jgi:hypothetical protein
MPVSLPRCGCSGPARCRGGRDGIQGQGGRGGPLLSREQPKALLLLPTMSCRNKQVNLLLLRGRGAMIEGRRPLLVFSHVSLTMMQPTLSLSLSALAAKTGAGGEKRPLLPMPPPPPTVGRDTLKI